MNLAAAKPATASYSYVEKPQAQSLAAYLPWQLTSNAMPPNVQKTENKHRVCFEPLISCVVPGVANWPAMP